MPAPMRVLVEVLHPAHVHFFRNAIAEWQRRGDEVLVLSREKEVANHLLRAYGIEFESISRLGGGKLGLLSEMVVRDVRMLRRALSFRPDVLVGIMGVTIAQVGLVIRKPAVVFYDTENARLTNRVVYPLAHSVCTPQCYRAEVPGRHVTYPGYHELAYLHPDRFTPDPRVVERGGVDPDQEFFIARFVSWQASHDVGYRAFDVELKRSMVQKLSARGRVLISSEGPLPADLEPMRFRAPPEDILHYLAFSRMILGDSATMSSEAAVLGVPALYISDASLGYLEEEEERYGLVFNFPLSRAHEAATKLDELLATPDLQRTMAERRQKLLSERIDTTRWLLDYVDGVVRETQG